MKSIFGAISTVVGIGVHAASGGWLCRICGKPIEASSGSETRCAKCVREGKR
jgi:hypothetical protein